MSNNEANWDRVVRVVVGVVLLALVFVGPQTAWGYLGAIPLLTGIVGYCPLYKALGWSTCRGPQPPRDSAHST